MLLHGMSKLCNGEVTNLVFWFSHGKRLRGTIWYRCTAGTYLIHSPVNKTKFQTEMSIYLGKKQKDLLISPKIQK